MYDGVNSPPAKRGLIFFDITMLAIRAPLTTPTGIARVELAYALELLKRYSHRVRFVVAMDRMVQVVPNVVARRYLASTELAWRYQQSKHGEGNIQRLANFLGVDRALFPSQTECAATSARKLLLAANLLIHVALRNLLPRGLGAFSNSESQNVYIHVSGSNLPSRWIERWLARSPSVSSIFMLHDIIPLTHPEYVRAKVPHRHAKYVRRITKAADVVVANSSFTAESLERFTDENDLRMPRTIVAPLGTSEVFSRVARIQAGVPSYFVFVSTIEPRKNHLTLLRVWARLVNKLGDQAPKLIIVGQRGWGTKNLTDILESAYSSGQPILECNNLCDETLVALLRNARAALMPSRVEGYGLPVAEALSLGTPVICSDLAPYREIAGDVPEYVNPLEGRGWTKLVMEYTRSDSPARLAQLERIHSYRPPNWGDHFDQVGHVINSLSVKLNAVVPLSTNRDLDLVPSSAESAAVQP